MSTAFDIQTEVTNLAERIVGPVAVKLAQKELDTAMGQIRHAFEQLSINNAPANVDFENKAVNILEPVRPKLSEADFARIVDRLRGAMAGFCQRDEAKAQPEAEPWWSTSEQAMMLFILLWLCTAIDCQLR